VTTAHFETEEALVLRFALPGSPLSTDSALKENSPDLAILLRTLTAGGVERVILNLASSLAEQGLKIDLVLLKAGGVNLDQMHPKVRLVDLNTVRVDDRRKFKSPTGFQSTRSLFKLIKYLRQEKPAVLLSATHFPNEVAILAKHLAQVPTRVVVSEHTALSVEARRVEQVSARLAPLTARLLYPFADDIIAVSQGVATDLARLTGLKPDRIQVIYNPVIMPNLIERAQEPIDHPWFAENELPVVLGVGRFVEQKSFSTLIRAFAQVRKVRPARLVLLGGGRERSRLQALVNELDLAADVALLEFVKNPYPFMKRAGVFVLSSAWEGLPTVLIEAMALQTPIVSTNCPFGPQEILADGKYGTLVPVGDEAAIAREILNVLSNPPVPVDPAWCQQFTLQAATQNYLSVLGIPCHES
jgi:glycosyltransferase involved in cell wall biosynthesis